MIQGWNPVARLIRILEGLVPISIGFRIRHRNRQEVQFVKTEHLFELVDINIFR